MVRDNITSHITGCKHFIKRGRSMLNFLSRKCKKLMKRLMKTLEKRKKNTSKAKRSRFKIKLKDDGCWKNIS